MATETKTPLSLTVQRIKIAGLLNGHSTTVDMPGFVLGPIGLHQSIHWDNQFALTLLSNGRSIMDGLGLDKALIALERLQGFAWVEPFTAEAKAVEALTQAFGAAHAEVGGE